MASAQPLIDPTPENVAAYLSGLHLDIAPPLCPPGAYGDPRYAKYWNSTAANGTVPNGNAANGAAVQAPRYVPRKHIHWIGPRPPAYLPWAPSSFTIKHPFIGQWGTLPATEGEWVTRAREVAEVLAVDAVTRDKEGKTPHSEVELLKDSGLLKVLGPAKYGGGGQTWAVALKVIREVAKGDGSIGMLLGYHCIWSTTPDILGTPEQVEKMQELITSNNYFVGGAVNPRDNDLTCIDKGDCISFNGFKHFNTGGVISDMTVLEGVLEGTDQHIFALVKTKYSGMKFQHDWDAMGMRLTESGSVKLDNVRAPWSDALGYDMKTKKPLPEFLKVPFATLIVPTFELIFANFYLGIAQGALDFAKTYTTTKTRAWPYGGDNKEKATDEWYILERYGSFKSHLDAGDALANVVGLKLTNIFEYGVNPLDRFKLTARERGEVAVAISQVKVFATDTALRVTSGIFEVTGAKSTFAKVGMDRFWRDVRTHSLHDPVAYKNREVGRYFLVDEIPEPTWYT